MAQKRYRNWVFTHNNYTEDDEMTWNMQMMDNDGPLEYCMYGREVGEAGTPHLQGILRVPNAKTLAALKAALDDSLNGVHFEPMAGSFEQAHTYCSKDGDVWEAGRRPKMGRRTDLECAVEAAQSGKKMREALEDGSIRSFQAVAHYATLMRALRPEPPAWRKMRCMWLVGGTGIGKTVAANLITEEQGDAYRPVTIGERIWMGYDGQSVMIIDDVAEVKKEFLDAFNQVLGGGRCLVRVGGGAVPCHVTTVIITSHDMPQELFDRGRCADRWPEVCRRLNRGVFRVETPLAHVNEVGGALQAELTDSGKVLEAHFKADALPAPLPALSAYPAMGEAYAAHAWPEPEAGEDADVEGAEG